MHQLRARLTEWDLTPPKKTALIFVNGYVQTPSIPHFKGFMMRKLQYQIRNCQNVVIKAKGHILFGSIFIA